MQSFEKYWRSLFLYEDECGCLFFLTLLQTPTLVIYGEQDTGMGFHSKEVLAKLKKSKTFEVKNAGHPCYQDQPESFMEEFFKFLMCSIRN